MGCCFPVHLAHNLSVYLFICLHICLSACLSVLPASQLFIYPSIHPSIFPKCHSKRCILHPILLACLSFTYIYSAADSVLFTSSYTARWRRFSEVSRQLLLFPDYICAPLTRRQP